MPQPIVEIKKPCFETLEKRRPGEQGSFCKTCQITVIDFTNKTPEEISRYLILHKTDVHCGTFNRKDISTGSRSGKFISYLQSHHLKVTAAIFLSFVLLISCRVRRGKVSHGPGFDNKQESSVEHLK